jgi:NAD-dependent SIR2 family protein deacetylase
MPSYSDKIERLRSALAEADGVLIGAGAGLSTSAGFSYSAERFKKYFSDFAQKYGIKDMYSGGFYPFEDMETYWAWWSRQIWCNRYGEPVGQVYYDLLTLVRDKNYFVLTTNVDHCFQRAGFDKKRLFYTQGDYGLWQCSVPCHNKTYDNEKAVKAMMEEQRNMRIPFALIPRCPRCGKPMTMNLRSDDTFVEDDGWRQAADRYGKYLHETEGKKVLFLELGVGGNTPGIIKYPFWRRTAENKKATYCCVNLGEAFAPKEIEKQSVCIDKDIAEVVADLLKK